MSETVVGITHLRDCLGIAYQHVVNTDEPIVVQRYKRQDVMLVPAWEWRFLKRVEADLRAGRRPWEDAKEESDDADQ
jgi:PHD/YefM family antitoxin component YafN of YafNO toxin-antitoxin module